MPEQLQRVINLLDSLAPPELAEEWDNTGLLVEPGLSPTVEVILLTIDLTEAVMEEAVVRGADLVVSYHPPIFSGLKSLSQHVPLQRSLIRALQQGISIYSPHTALDAAEGGVNDWLADGLGSGSRSIIEPNPGSPELGQGRRVTLDEPVTLETLVQRVKTHLGINQLRVAYGHDPASKISSIALCPGAGGSVISNQDADVLLTGEMRHHDVLAAAASGKTVILSEHTHTERGYLSVLQEKLRSGLRGVEVILASRDDDPLQWV